MATATVAHEQLGRYLNDHLAGSVMALELLDLLESHERGPAQREFIAGLRNEIVADREVLTNLLARLNIVESRPRQAIAWLATKLSEWKLRWDDQTDGAFCWFEALEALSLGVEGKRLLWVTLADIAAEVAELRTIDYARLIQRAEAQRHGIESLRLSAARKILASSHSSIS